MTKLQTGDYFMITKDAGEMAADNGYHGQADKGTIGKVTVTTTRRVHDIHGSYEIFTFDDMRGNFLRSYFGVNLGLGDWIEDIDTCDLVEGKEYFVFCTEANDFEDFSKGGRYSFSYDDCEDEWVVSDEDGDTHSDTMSKFVLIPEISAVTESPVKEETPFVFISFRDLPDHEKSALKLAFEAGTPIQKLPFSQRFQGESAFVPNNLPPSSWGNNMYRIAPEAKVTTPAEPAPMEANPVFVAFRDMTAEQKVELYEAYHAGKTIQGTNRWLFSSNGEESFRDTCAEPGIWLNSMYRVKPEPTAQELAIAAKKEMIEELVKSLTAANDELAELERAA